MKSKLLLQCFVLLAYIGIPCAHALKFSNQFVEFELPMKWQCALEGAEWVCQSTDDQKKKDAIIVLAAKLKGEQDTLDRYQEFLAKPKTFNSPNGAAVASEPKYAKVIQINGTPWVDSIHLQSEIPGFYTRYLATVKQDIGVLVTYTINKNKYQEYLAQFDEMVKSLKVFRKAGGMNANTGQSIFSQAQLPSTFTQNQVFPDQAPATADANKPKPKEEDNTMLLLLLVALAVGYIVIKKRKKQS